MCEVPEVTFRPANQMADEVVDFWIATIVVEAEKVGRLPFRVSMLIRRTSCPAYAWLAASVAAVVVFPTPPASETGV